LKIVLSDKKLGRSTQMELQLDKASALLNKKIGEEVDGTFLGLTGYKFKISGGSDKSGFPMERSMEGTGKVSVLKRIALSGRSKGQYRRENKRGNMISPDIEQVNLVVLEYGDRSAEEIFPKKEGKKAEKKDEKAEKPKAEAKA
jgi:small subunit ribosomal protein S6e